MSNDSFTKEDLIEIRKNHAIKFKSGGYGYWKPAEVEQKRYRTRPDTLSKEDRAKVDAAKDKLNNSDENYLVEIWDEV